MKKAQTTSPTLTIRNILTAARHAFILSANEANARGFVDMRFIYETLIDNCEKHLIALGVRPMVDFEPQKALSARIAARKRSALWGCFVLENFCSDPVLNDIRTGRVSILSESYPAVMRHLLRRFELHLKEVSRLTEKAPLTKKRKAIPAKRRKPRPES
jgi:hypothetical protein